MRVAGGRAATTNRGFAFSTTKRLGLKESSNHTNVDYDLHKRDSLAKQKKGSGHWKPELASDSEEAVKADRASRDKDAVEQMKALQERTKRAAEETSKAAAMSSSAPSFQSALLAGAIAGTTVDLSLFPLDTLKTRLQSSAGFFPSGGFSGIYRGIGSALVGSAPGAAFFFCTYETAKAVLGPRIRSGVGSGSGHGGGGGWAPADVLTHMLASSLGEIAACSVRVPTEVVKQRAQAGHHGGSSAKALGHILSRYSAPGGSLPAVWRELYRGWGITVIREVPFTMIQFPLWEGMKAWGRKRRGDGKDVSAGESALYGSLAGGVAAASTTPLDVLKTRVMLSRERVSVGEVLQRMAREEGIRPFFAGIAPRITWISIGGAIFLGSYQYVINTMNSINS
ncbi:mitochondrial carrier protein PET8 [Trichoderma ceciliae]